MAVSAAVAAAPIDGGVAVVTEKTEAVVVSSCCWMGLNNSRAVPSFEFNAVWIGSRRTASKLMLVSVVVTVVAGAGAGAGAVIRI